MKIYQCALFCMLLTLSSLSTAMSLVNDGDSNNNTVKNEFALSGVIQQYTDDNSSITINDNVYILIDKSGLSKQDLSIGSKVNYNIEQSTNEEFGRITKIWKNANE